MGPFHDPFKTLTYAIMESFVFVENREKAEGGGRGNDLIYYYTTIQQLPIKYYQNVMKRGEENNFIHKT